MIALPIGKPYSWNGCHRAHWGLQRINTIEKRQQDRTDLCLRTHVIWRLEKAAAIPSSPSSAPQSTWSTSGGRDGARLVRKSEGAWLVSSVAAARDVNQWGSPADD